MNALGLFSAEEFWEPTAIVQLWLPAEDMPMGAETGAKLTTKNEVAVTIGGFVYTPS